MGRAKNPNRHAKNMTVKPRREIKIFPIIATVAVALVIALITVVTINMNRIASEPKVAPSANTALPSAIKTVIDEETGTVSIGEGDTVVDEYFDFGCPYCGEYHENTGDLMHEKTAEGKITLNLHPLGLLNNSFQGTEFSTRSANAFYCVVENEPNSALAMLDNLYLNQPEELTEGLTDDELVKIASNAGAKGEKIESCINENTYGDFVDSITQKLVNEESAWFKGTPTVKIDGEFVDNNSVAELIQGL